MICVIGAVVYRIDHFTSACYLAFMESGNLRCAAADMKVIARGEEGVRLFHQGRRLEFKSERTFKVPDTTGAGDQLLGALLTQLDRGVSMEKAVSKAMRAVENALGENRL